MSDERPQALPDAHFLQSIAARPWMWKGALAEWIDNSFDAEATTVAIEFGDNRVTVIDNGRGTDDLAPFATFGASRKHPNTKLGRFGVGSKDAAMWIGSMSSTLTVRSVRASRVRTLSVNWNAMAQDSWRYDPVLVEDASPGDVGTIVSVTPVIRRIPNGTDWDDLLDELGYMYSPAIKQGRQITMRARKGVVATPVPRWTLPRFDGPVIDQTIIVGGKAARVYCGLVAEGEANPRRGMTYSHEFRVLIPASQRGCGSVNVSRVCGFVALGDKWRITKNKDAIDDGEDQLYEAVESVCRPVFDRATAIGMAMASAAFEAQVAATLNAGLESARKKARRRSPENETGTKRATGRGSRHRDARRKQPGETFDGCSPELRIHHDHRGIDGGIGEFLSPNIYLNLDNPCVAQAYREQNILASVVMASSLVGIDVVLASNDPQLRLRGISDGDAQSKTFSRAMGTILSGNVTVNGQPLKVSA